MPQYLTPGVYVEEVDAGPKPIEGVSTNVAGFVGVTARGPTEGKPVLVTSYAEFERVFGGVLDKPSEAIQSRWTDRDEGGQWWSFALAVRGFFENGGRQLFVRRVVPQTAAAAQADLGRGLAVEIAADVSAGARHIDLVHLFGIEVNTPLTVYANGVALPNPFTVTAYDSVSKRVTLNNPLGQDLRAERDYVELAANPTPRSTVANVAQQRTMTFRAKGRGDWGNELWVRLRSRATTTVQLLADPVAGGPTARTTVAAAAAQGANAIQVASAASFAVQDRIMVGNRAFGVQAVAAGPPATLTIDVALPAAVAAGTAVRRLRPANAGATDRFRVQGAAQVYKGAMVELDNGTVKFRTTVKEAAEGDAVLLSAASPANVVFREGDRLRVLEAEVNVQYWRNDAIEAEESFAGLRLVDDGTASYLATHINERSDLVTVEVNGGPQGQFSASDPLRFPVVPRPAGPSPLGLWMQLQGGADNIDALNPSDFIGENLGSGKRTGIQALEDIDDISLAAAPGIWAGTVRTALISHCERLRYRFAIVDPWHGLKIADGPSIQEIRAFREPMDTRYAALYYPWIVVLNPRSGCFEPLAPSAHMVGLYARVDVERGVHKAPANEVIRGIRLPNPAKKVSGIAGDVSFFEQELLNPFGINALRYFPNRGQRVWGARTLSSDSSWKYINVRRIFIYVEASVDRGTQWVVFEPNDEGTWTRVRQTVTNFLRTTWRSGALEGATEAEAFFVRCDRTMMTQDDIDNGRLICVIGIAPVKPAEFVIFRIQQLTREAP